MEITNVKVYDLKEFLTEKIRRALRKEQKNTHENTYLCGNSWVNFVIC